MASSWRLTVELSGAHAAVRAWHFILHACDPSICYASFACEDVGLTFLRESFTKDDLATFDTIWE